MSLNFSQSYRCASCGEDPYLSGPLRVSCAECPGGLELCLECLASKVELGAHRSSHKYRLVDNGGLLLLGSSWTARELVQLLDGLEQFGHGNWNDVARYVETKGPAECREAVNNHFVTGPIGSITYKEEQRGSAKDHTVTPSTSGGSSSTGSLGLHEVILLGCMPARDDFEVEHCNEAEGLVAVIEPAGGKGETEEDEVEIMIKLAQVDMYKAKLRERERRKTVAKELGLLEAFFKENPLNPTTGRLAAPRPKKKDSRNEVFERLKVMSSIQGIEEYKKLTASVTKEKELKSRIKELIRYRKNGIHQLTEAEQYEAERIRRNKRKAERKRILEGGEGSVVLEDTVSPAKEETVLDLDTITSISGLPGCDVLSVNEKRLCTSLRLHPNLYISYKTCLLRDHLSKKKGQIPKPVHPSGLDKLHRKKIFNFLLQSGWISAY